MSFATALGFALGGYGQGRQQKFANEEQQKSDAERAQEYAEQKRIDDANIARQQMLDKQAQEDRLRARGIDPATGQPFVVPPGLSQIAPGNKGKVPVDPTTGKPYAQGASPQQLLGHYLALANWQKQTGQDPSSSIAMAQDIQRQILADQSQQAQWMRDVYNQQHSDQRTLDIINAANGRHTEMTPYEMDELRLRGQDLDLRRQELRVRGARGTGPKVSDDQAQGKYAAWTKDFDELTKPKVSQLGVPQPPLVSNADIGAVRKKLGGTDPFARIDRDPDPITTANQIAALTGNASLQHLLRERGVVAHMKQEAKQQDQGYAAVGGSDDDGNFLPPASPWP